MTQAAVQPDAATPKRPRAALLRPFALVLLVLVTAVGVYGLWRGDPQAAAQHWIERWRILPIVIACVLCDRAMECIAWLWVYHRFGVRSWNRSAVLAFLAGRAGLLLPAQLGRLIPPDAMARHGFGPTERCLKAEASAFALNTAAVGALIIVLLVAKLAGAWLGLVAGIAMLLALRAVALFGSGILEGTRFAVPRAFVRSRAAMCIVLIQMAGWAAHGTALWVMIHDLAAGITLHDTALYACIAAILGAGSGLPGGIGATEGLLGVSLSIMKIPPEHLVIAIASFRLITFWIWIPIGWIALLLTNARVRAAAATAGPTMHPVGAAA
ncbi:MAG: flippase-like domain-containing protein [Phycisphaerales bacterium]|nr:flippase-like domain-containing protein [Phycisphaerales bacterium]